MKYTEQGHPKELDRYVGGKSLLAFNVTKKRIADLCNRELREAFPWKEEINYSSYHRAIDGKEVWDELVRMLESLEHDQAHEPRKYVPAPGDDLRAWMKEIAGATWWCRTLELPFDPNTLVGWFSGRKLSDKNLDVVRERALAWWAKFDHAAEWSHDLAWLGRCGHASEPDKHTVDTLIYSLLNERSLPRDEAKKRFVTLRMSTPRLIDLADPKFPLRVMDLDVYRDQASEEFEDVVARGMPLAVPRECPDVDLTPTVQEKRWGDRRSEQGPWDVNEPLYRLHYRERVTPLWDQEERRVEKRREIVEVSEDGVTWRAPTEREKQGWDEQLPACLRHAEEHGEFPDNAYKREVNAARVEVQQARSKQNSRNQQWERGKRLAPDAGMDEQLRLGREALDEEVAAAERKLRRAREDF